MSGAEIPAAAAALEGGTAAAGAAAGAGAGAAAGAGAGAGALTMADVMAAQGASEVAGMGMSPLMMSAFASQMMSGKGKKTGAIGGTPMAPMRQGQYSPIAQPNTGGLLFNPIPLSRMNRG